MLAINNAHYDVAALLVEQGADPNVADVTGMTALYAAVNMNTLADLPGRPAPKPTGSADAGGRGAGAAGPRRESESQAARSRS